MFMLSEDVKLTLVQPGLADGQTDPDSARVDMQGFDGVMFVGVVGTITGSGTVELAVKQADTDIVGAALAGASATAEGSANSDKLLVIDIDKPRKRYVGTTLTRAVANSIYGGTIAIQYKGRNKPVVTAAAQLAADIVRLLSPAQV
ncbi:MAG: hypothetical protein JW809_14935 [Pirellulales bacterium]|nr:hypothetical protein [Pirellulales bacterium]